MTLRRHLWRDGGTVIAAAALAMITVVPTATATATATATGPTGRAVRPGPDVDSPTIETTTTVPTPETAPSTTPPVSADSTTSSSSTTSTTVPGTTLPPVDDAIIDSESSGFSSLPAPLIPSAADDPLFHAALTVDDDLVNLSKAKVVYLKQIAATRKVADRAASVRSSYERVDAADVDARRHLNNTKSILRAAALHAYTGFGSVETASDSPEVNDSGKVLPYRTYVRVTIADATRHVSEAEDAQGRTGADADAAKAKDRSARAELKKARADERAAKKAVADAKDKLDRDRAALRLLIADLPGMAPGTLDRLPDDVELPEGAIPVESPVGTIVVPASADPRTATALQFMIAQIGKPYLWGGTGPNSYDCSGLMLRGFQAAGISSMPRVSQGQQVWATPIDAKDAQPGDLVFFGTPAYHVGIYIGGGLMIDAPYTGARVRVDPIWPSVSGYGRARW
ncbi:MAG TPA: NlpC/P60 family protein [Acidimicrobiales bacterium]|nr:NlpC/P60 family protein [Acidimicrobiales bacterium]